MKKMIAIAAIAAAAVGAAFALEHDTPQASGDYASLTAGEKVYAGNIAAVATNGCAYAVNTSAIGGTLTVCGVFQRTAEAGEDVLVKRGGFLLENAGNITKAEIGSTAYSTTNNAWTVTKTSGTKTVGKIADVRAEGVVVVVGR